MRPLDLHHLVVVPTLHTLGLYSHAAAQLVTATACHESRCGHYLKQVNGPALGPWQIEPATHRDLFDNFLRYRPEHRRNLLLLAARCCTDERLERIDIEQLERQLVTNLAYGAAVCRLLYFRRPEQLPPANNPYLQAEYWKAHYNTQLGKGTVAQFVASYPNELLV